jgi:hypothetical protein
MVTLIKPSEAVGGGIMRAAPQSARMDVQLIAPHVASAEREFVKNLLGSALFADMVALQNTAQSNYNPALGALVPKFPANPNYEALWVLALLELESTAVLYQALPFISAQIGSNGVLIPQGVNTVAASSQQAKDMADNLSRRIKALQCEIFDYLEENAALFPLYEPKNKNGCGDKKCGYSGDFGVVIY